ncbi:Protein of unknown function [Gryllus bimaculatus]|nr:Protein of unknown function [Gryllus bimaculatus]
MRILCIIASALVLTPRSVAVLPGLRLHRWRVGKWSQGAAALALRMAAADAMSLAATSFAYQSLSSPIPLGTAIEPTVVSSQIVNGQFSAATARAKVAERYKDNADALKVANDSIDTCAKEVTGTDACETGTQLRACIDRTAKQLFSASR